MTVRLYLIGTINKKVFAVRAENKWQAAELAWGELNFMEREAWPPILLEKLADELEPEGNAEVLMSLEIVGG